MSLGPWRGVWGPRAGVAMEIRRGNFVREVTRGAASGQLGWEVSKVGRGERSPLGSLWTAPRRACLRMCQTMQWFSGFVHPAPPHPGPVPNDEVRMTSSDSTRERRDAVRIHGLLSFGWVDCGFLLDCSCCCTCSLSPILFGVFSPLSPFLGSLFGGVPLEIPSLSSNTQGKSHRSPKGGQVALRFCVGGGSLALSLFASSSTFPSPHPSVFYSLSFHPTQTPVLIHALPPQTQNTHTHTNTHSENI